MRNWVFAATALLGATALIGCVNNPVDDAQVANADKEAYCQTDESIGTHLAPHKTCSDADAQMSILDSQQDTRGIQQRGLAGHSASMGN